MDAEATKREKARQMRYKKAIVKNMNFQYIRDTLWDIQEECEGVKWYVDGDDETLINALDGNEDEAYEFKMMFADLCAECEQMIEDLDQWWIDDDFIECFDNFFVAIKGGDNASGLLGWDSYEQDYYGIDYEDYAEQEAGKKLMRLTKEKIVQTAGMCFKIAMAFIGLQNRYDNLKAAMDILKDQNTGYLQMVRQIEELYDKIEFSPIWGASNTKEFDRYVEALPQEAWIQ